MSNATYALNGYLWKALQANLGWDSADYEGARPIIPASAQPEFMQKAKPFIIYSSSAPPTTHLWAMRNEAVAYSVFATSVSEANKIVELMVSMFERQDELVGKVNEWLDIEKVGRLAEGKQPRGIAFNSIKLAMSQRAEATNQEGGYYSALVIVDFKTINNANPILDGFTYP